MPNRVKEAKSKKTAEDKKPEEFLYLNEDVKDFAFSDYVRIKSCPRGMLFSFGKRHPEDGRFVLFQEILLPFDVAVSLQRIIDEQIDHLVSQGLLEIREPPQGEGKKK